MSIQLTSGTFPHGLDVRTYSSRLSPTVDTWHGSGGTVRIGQYLLSMRDFIEVARYALTNSNLEGESDPRVAFVKQLAKMKLGEGFGDSSAQRLMVDSLVDAG